MTTSPKVKCVDTGTLVNADDAMEYVHPKTGNLVSPLSPQAYAARCAGKPMNTVSHPNHYNQYSVECIKVIEHYPHNLGAAIKYVWRAGEKNPLIQDLEKAKWYLERHLNHPVIKTSISTYGVQEVPGLYQLARSEMEDWKIGILSPLFTNVVTEGDVRLSHHILTIKIKCTK